MTAAELRSIRKSTKLTQVQFTKLINTPLGTFKSWEQGRHRIPGSASRLILNTNFVQN